MLNPLNPLKTSQKYSTLFISHSSRAAWSFPKVAKQGGMIAVPASFMALRRNPRSPAYLSDERRSQPLNERKSSPLRRAENRLSVLLRMKATSKVLLDCVSLKEEQILEKLCLIQVSAVDCFRLYFCANQKNLVESGELIPAEATF